MITGKYFFRQWASAEEPQLPPGASAPAAPYALDFKETSEKKSLQNTHMAATWSEETERRSVGLMPAGTRPWDGRDAAHCLHKSNWEAEHWKALATTYMSDSNTEELARYHRKFVRNLGKKPDEREARWRKCFMQWEGHTPDDMQSRVTGTDYSMMPAGWRAPDKNFRKRAQPAPAQQAQDYAAGLSGFLAPAGFTGGASVPLEPRAPTPRAGAAAGPPRPGRSLRSNTGAPSPPPEATATAIPEGMLYRKKDGERYALGEGGNSNGGSIAGESDVNLSPSDTRAVNGRTLRNAMNSWDFMAKLARRKGGRDPSATWAPVAGHVPMNHAR